MQSETLADIRLGIIKLFQDNKVEADAHLIKVSPKGGVNFLVTCNTDNVTKSLIKNLSEINASPNIPFKFDGGDINTHSTNVFFFRFSIEDLEDVDTASC
jgi:hypothetical protein